MYIYIYIYTCNFLKDRGTPRPVFSITFWPWFSKVVVCHSADVCLFPVFPCGSCALAKSEGMMCWLMTFFPLSSRGLRMLEGAQPHWMFLMLSQSRIETKEHISANKVYNRENPRNLRPLSGRDDQPSMCGFHF